MKTLLKRRLPAVLACALLMGATLAPPASAGPRARVDRFQPGSQRLVLVKGDRVIRKSLSDDVKVLLKNRAGQKQRADVNELVAGAVVLKLADTDDDGDIDKAILRELPSGSSDCSFDESEESESDEEGSESSVEESWSCDLDYEGIDSDISRDCSFDMSREGYSEANEGEHEEEVSWDCSYDESNDEEDLSWDCSYDSSEATWWEGPEGGSEGDTSFDCSWDSSVPLDAPLWDCAITEVPFGWSCTSEKLGQSFGATLQGAPIGFDAFLDLSADHLDLDSDDSSASCSDDGAGFSCSFETEDSDGDCEIEFSIDESAEPDGTGGDVSGDMSYSCSNSPGPQDPDEN